MRVRPAARDDLAALARLTQRCAISQRDWAGPETPVPGLAAEELEWELRFARTGAWLAVAVDDEDPEAPIVGACAFATATVSREARTLVPDLAHVNAVFVDPDHWRRGIARLMLDAAETAMVAGGHRRAQLWTLEGSPAEHLYRALGWKADGRREVYPPMRLTVVAYVKSLPARRT